MYLQQMTTPFLLLFAAVFTLSVQCGKQKKEPDQAIVTPAVQAQISDSTQVPVTAATSIESIANLDDLNAIVEGTPGKLLVFDLYADWCKPCKMLAPVFTSLADTHAKNARFFRVDVQNNPDVAASFGVRGIPYVVFIKDKEVVHTLTGLNPREYYERVITTCGASTSVAECRAGLDKL